MFQTIRSYRAYTRTMPVIITLLAAVCLTLAVNAYVKMLANPAPQDRLVTFYDRGEKRVILTKAQSVADALKDAQITTIVEDDIEPAPKTKLTDTDSVVNIHRARPIVIVDGPVRQKVFTTADVPGDIVLSADLAELREGDKTTFSTSDDPITYGSQIVLTVDRADKNLSGQPKIFGIMPGPNALSRSKGAQQWADSRGIIHRETYYDLPMNAVIGTCGPGNYTIRFDGAKIDKDGYILVAANLINYPRCSVVETSMGLGKVYDTGGFALRHPYGYDLATDWSNGDGR